jgi:coenzyme Q-binding protein COQ10
MQRSESRVVPYSADLMYRVVADIEHYPQFLPWVSALRLLSREERMLTAEMLVGFGPFREKYTSQITLDPAALTVDVSAIKGPFRQLENHWRFEPQDEGCRIDFSIEFEFRNPLLQAAASAAFEKVLMKMTDAFVARAAQLTAS